MTILYDGTAGILERRIGGFGMRLFGAIALLLAHSYVHGAEPAAAERGKKALETTAFIKAFWPTSAYEAAWKSWGVKGKPVEYAKAFRDRYGLHEAPYGNNGLPMGLRKADLPLGQGIGIDCMTCHGGSIHGKSMIGLGNASLDIHSLFEEMAKASNAPAKLPFAFSQVRGTSEAGAFAVYLLGFRTPELGLSTEFHDLGLKDDACEDVPAWWLLKKKKTMYHVGATDARSVRSIMQFMMHPLTTPGDFAKAEPVFKDVLEYLLSIEAPKYPYPIDQRKAVEGEKLFSANCASCHGTYGEKWTYPNKIIPLATIGTDRKRFDNIGPKFGEAYNASWFAKEGGGKPVKATEGYQAPPLDGIWATAPYFHNGSVPTLDGVLNSTARPKVFTRGFGTSEADYDTVNVGWKVHEPPAHPQTAEGHERRKIYDTTQPGRGNGGHTYGDGLTPEERAAVIEYLKTL
jgi:mono/diheme cytochrome c family protein